MGEIMKKVAEKKRMKAQEIVELNEAVAVTEVTQIHPLVEAWRVHASGQIAKKLIDVTKRSKWAFAADAAEAAGLMPVSVGQSQDAIKEWITTILTCSGDLTADMDKKTIGRVVNTARNGIYRCWGIYGNGTEKRPYRIDLEKADKDDAADQKFLEGLSVEMRAVALAYFAAK